MKIQAKLKSQTGASITYALLLFLVCAVVSSVVLAAGTAASGRMSQSVESDQRYYAVTSAAEYLKSMIDGKTVVVEKATTTDTSGSGDPVVVQKMDGDEYTDTLASDFVKEAAACYKRFKTLSDASRTIELKVGREDSLTANIEETLDSSSGRIKLEVSNADAVDDGSGKKTGIYTITLIFDAEIKDKTQKKTSGTKKTVTETTTMTWSLTSIG